jgi:hypothetical protein
VVRRLLAVVALGAAAAAVLLVVTRPKTHDCDVIDYAAFRAAPAGDARLDQIGSRIERCDALAGLTRQRVRTLLGPNPNLGSNPTDHWDLGYNDYAIDGGSVLAVTYEHDIVKKVRIYAD